MVFRSSLLILYSLMMSSAELKLSNQKIVCLVKPLVSIASSCFISMSSFDINRVTAAPPPMPITSTLSLEQTVQNLEKANKREDVLQSLADVYEVSGTKSLQAKTKFKQRIIEAVNNQHIKLSNNWDQALRYASGEVKRRVDPYRTIDLGPYLKIAPFIGGACYLGALFIQQTIPELFIFAYPLAVFIFTIPIIFIITFT